MLLVREEKKSNLCVLYWLESWHNILNVPGSEVRLPSCCLEGRPCLLVSNIFWLRYGLWWAWHGVTFYSSSLSTGHRDCVSHTEQQNALFTWFWPRGCKGLTTDDRRGVILFLVRCRWCFGHSSGKIRSLPKNVQLTKLSLHVTK